MLSQGDAVHPVAQVSAVQPDSFYYYGPKISNSYADKTHTYGHCKCHYPEARLTRWKSMPDAPSEHVCHNCIQKTEAEDYRCIHNNVSIPTVLTNNGDVDTMMLCNALEQCRHAFITSLVILR